MRDDLLARFLVERLLGAGFAYPLCMSDVCEYLGVALRFCELGSTDGCHMRDKSTEREIILINENMSAVRQRFSVAHEIGHIKMKHPPRAVCEMACQRTQKKHEVEANNFASELLMPKVLLQSCPIPAKEIATLFQVSLEAASIRAERLGWS